MDTAEKSSPTLLSLPPELRNAIFSYVYGKAVANHIILLRFQSGRAGVESDKAPPNKNSLLICRQIYNETKKMQAAAYRRYWMVQKFLIIADRDTKKDLHLATKADLQHICHLAVHRYFDWPEKYTALISFNYTAEFAWRVSMESARPQQARPCGCRFAWYLVKCSDSMFFLRTLKVMMDTLHDDRGAGGYLDESTNDPRVGRGLDADEMHQLPFTVREYR
jgi:hypothetical protein